MVKLSNKFIYTITIIIVLLIFGINYELLYIVSFKKPDNYIFTYSNILNQKKLSHYYVLGVNHSQLLIMINSNCKYNIIFNFVDHHLEYPIYEVTCNE